jgi:RNA polymerase sigma-70 factor (ECF subfamily)
VALIDEVDDEAADDEKTGVDAAGAGLSAEQRLVDAQRSEQLWSAVRRLAWSQREALVLVDLQERSYEEAAAVAGTRVDVLRSRLHRARARLAELLAAPQGEPKP